MKRVNTLGEPWGNCRQNVYQATNTMVFRAVTHNVDIPIWPTLRNGVLYPIRNAVWDEWWQR